MNWDIQSLALKRPIGAAVVLCEEDMKPILSLLLAISLIGVLLAEDDVVLPQNPDLHITFKGEPPEEKIVVVRDDPNVYTFKPEPFEGSGHGDGTASVDFMGVVVEETQGKEVPVVAVRFSVEPDRTFAHHRNKKVIFLSNTNGDFFAVLYVGCARTRGGKTPGRVYLSRRSKLRIEKEGYRTKFLWFDYEMPKVKIIMTKEDPQTSAAD